MSSRFSGTGPPEIFTAGMRSTNKNGFINNNLNPQHQQQQQFSFRSSPLAGILHDPDARIRGSDHLIGGKRSLSEFHFSQQQQQNLGFHGRNVKPRLPGNGNNNYHHAASPISTLSTVDFSPVPSISSDSSNALNLRYGLPIIQQHRRQPLAALVNRNTNGHNLSSCDSLPYLARNLSCTNTETSISAPGSEVLESDEKTICHQLQELEKALLGDDDEVEENTDAVAAAESTVTNSDWSYTTIQNLIAPTRKPVVSPSPTSSSSSSSCCSTSASPPTPPTKQSLIDAAAAISEGKLDAASEILTRLQQFAAASGSPEQRLAKYMASALSSRVNPTEHTPRVFELHGREQIVATQMLYEVSPCFKLGFMAANLAILDATSDHHQGFHKIHVVDFDIGQGGQYVHLLHALAAKKTAAALKITTLTTQLTPEEKLKVVGQGLRALANKLGVNFTFCAKQIGITDLTREKLGVEPDEALAVNFAFKLHTLPDESVTTENVRDEVLRRVRGLSPWVVTLVEQDMNTNTAPLASRVREACELYGALFESLEATLSRDNPERVRIEEAMGRKLDNSVACEGRDRVERYEVFGKWRARMGMAGFGPVQMGQAAAESLRVKLNSGTRGNPGFTVSEQFGGLCFGWMGRTITVASAWR